MKQERGSPAAVPFQGTVVVLHSSARSRTGAVGETIQIAFDRQTALRLLWRDVSPGSLDLAQQAAEIALANPCMLLAADAGARQAVSSWEVHYPEPRPPVFEVRDLDGLKLDSGERLQEWMDRTPWRTEAAVRQYGLPDGEPVENSTAVLGTLGRIAGAPVEVLLGYATGSAPAQGYGTLGLRIDDHVLSLHGLARRGRDSALFPSLSTADYLYGTRSAMTHFEFGVTYGVCYRRTVLGLRLFDVPRSTRIRMLEQAEEINAEWAEGRLLPGGLRNSAGTLTARLLTAGGLGLHPHWPRAPLDLLVHLLETSDAGRQANILVLYRKLEGVPLAPAEETFPRRLFRPWGSEPLRQKLETRAELRVESDPSSKRVELDARAYHWKSTVSRGRRLLLGGGTANVSGRVREATVLEMSHREPAFSALFEDLVRKLLALAGAPADRYQALLVGGSGDAAIEASVESMARLGRLVVLSNGDAGEKLAGLAALYRPDATQVCEFPHGTPYDFETIRRALKPCKGQVHFILAVHHETGAGILNDLAPVSAVVAENGSCFFVDATTSLGAHEIDLATLGATLVAGAAEGALGGSAGISFVLGDRQFFRRLQSTQARARYLDLALHYKLAVEKGQMPGAPPLPSMMGLAAALGELLERGRSNFAGELARRAAVVRRRLMGLGLKFPVEIDLLSNVSTPVLLPPGVRASVLQESLLARGFVTSVRTGEAESLMIGHAGALSASDINRFLEALEEEMAQQTESAPALAELPATGSRPVLVR